MITLMVTFEWLQRAREHGLEVAHWPPWVRRIVYAVLALLIVHLYDVQQEFIYFQF